MMDALSTGTHLHITAWAVGVILFFVAYFMSPATKGRKIVHMILRVFYLIIIFSGLLLFLNGHSIDDMLYGIKFLMGVVTIAMMEMALVKSQKGKNAKGFFIGFLIAFVITFLLGSYLPMGVLTFLR
ncbi:YisL family protein [Kurthia senegalensis]|uniref:YisL family protein n=1 Tax=Kurthia senegalensis TaxID=1033740 RepID=UPI000288EF21|nr:YisL family protein [Kurthia senegalensis]